MESTILAALLGVAAMVACLLFVVKPLWPPSATLSRKEGENKGWRASTVWSDWLDQKETLLFNLEDLVHEQRLGKISQEDFSRLQAAYKKQLVALLDQMDNSKPPADFEKFLLDAGIASGETRPRDDDRACFRCKAFYSDGYSFCPQCGSPLTVRS